MKSPYDSWILQSDMNNVQMWCISNYMKLNVNNIGVICFCSKTNCRGFDCNLSESSIIHTDCIRDMGVLTDTKLQRIEPIFSHAIGLLGIIHTVTFSFSSLYSLLTLYCTLVRPKLEMTLFHGILSLLQKLVSCDASSGSS